LELQRCEIEVRVLEPAANVLAFYEGRVEGHRFAEEENWVDEGAISLGIASYAILAGSEALVYDTHVSVERGAFIRRTLEERGVGEARRRAQPLAPRPRRGDRGLRRLRGTGARPHSRAARGQPRRDRGWHPRGPAADRPAGDVDAGLLGRRAPRPRRDRGRA